MNRVRSTYRLQLREGLTLDGVVEDGWLDHARDLGASHLYLSPVLTAVPGSTHGYDVVDPCRVDPAIGGDAAFRRLAERTAELGMGLVVDIVPNHMAADHTTNAWFRDVLRNGDLSEHASVFDLDPLHPEPRLQGRIVLPVLDDHYGRVLEAGRITVERRDTDVVALVDDRPFPLEPSSLAPLLEPVAAELDDDLITLVVTSLRKVDRTDAQVRAAELRALDAQLAVQLRRDHVAALVDRHLAGVTADPDAVHEVLEAQNYRLAYWRSARDLGYRRFFDINDLIGVRVEDPDVFDLTHAAVREWVDEGLVQGLRVDHPDGLADPRDYLQRLRALAPDAWIVVEKILEHGEELPGDWPVDGTTGYEVAELIGRWQLDPDGLHQLAALRDQLVGPTPTGAEMVAAAKRQAITELLPADLNRATDALLRMCESQRRFRDVTRHELHELLREVATSYPVYRSYVAPGEVAGPRDLGIVSATLASVAEARPDLDTEVVDLLGSVLTGRLDDSVPGAVEVRRRVQQLTGPAMAKGKEDTAFYREVRLVSRNEVGADPFAGVADPREVLDAAARWHDLRPGTMTLLSSHDSKRSEDVRARLSVLTEAVPEWSELARRWMQWCDEADPDGLVDAPTRYLLAQTAVGAHPVSSQRLADYALKAVREAKVATSWLVADPAYEDAVVGLATTLATDDRVTDAVEEFVDRVVGPPGRAAAVAQKVLQLTLVGVPDLYRASEDWFLRLVDPDNRVAPDLAALRRPVADQVGPADPDAKLHAVRRVLALRARRPESFGPAAAPVPLEVDGPDADRVLAFARGSVVVVAARCPRRAEPRCSVELPPGPWSVTIGGSVGGAVDGSVPELLGGWSVAVLEAADGTGSPR